VIQVLGEAEFVPPEEVVGVLGQVLPVPRVMRVDRLHEGVVHKPIHTNSIHVYLQLQDDDLCGVSVQEILDLGEDAAERLDEEEVTGPVLLRARTVLEVPTHPHIQHSHSHHQLFIDGVALGLHEVDHLEEVVIGLVGA